MKRCLAQGRERFELWVAGGRARQQPHEDCSPVGGPIIAQTKSRLTLPTIRTGKDTAAGHYDHVPSNGGVREIAEKIEPDPLSKMDIDRKVGPILLGNLRMPA